MAKEKTATLKSEGILAAERKVAMEAVIQEIEAAKEGIVRDQKARNEAEQRIRRGKKHLAELHRRVLDLAR